MIIRIFNFFLALLLSFNVKQRFKWFQRTSRKSIKNKQNDKADISPIRRNWTNSSHMINIVKLCDTNFLSDDIFILKIYQNLKIPFSNWTNVVAAMMVLFAVLNITSCNFSTADSFSWYSLFIVAATCIAHQLNVETDVLRASQDLQTLLFRLLPYRLISRLWGRWCCIYVISPFRPCLYKLFINVYGVKLEIVSPVDGTVIYNDVVYDGTIRHVKGINYSIQKFLGALHKGHGDSSNQVYAQNLMRNPHENVLYCSVIYLAAGDYHRFHSPADWKMLLRRHFAGDLLSVNPRFLSWMSDLFILNERVVLSGLWRHGFFSMTAVGALNVGSIVVHNDKTLHTNLPYALKTAYLDRRFEDSTVNYAKGDEVGMFKLGSTVVLIYEAPKEATVHCKQGEKIKYGERLMTC